MRIFLAGATGVVGSRLLPLLVERGHEVAATTRTSDKVPGLQAAGAEAVVLDILDGDAVMAAVREARPDVVVHQATALTGVGERPRRIGADFALTNRLRTEGGRHLLAAARLAGAQRLVAQSFTGWPNAREGGPVKTEEDPLDPHPPAVMRLVLDAIRALETTVAGARGIEGVVLRYGAFYGPGTTISQGGSHVELIRKRRFPIVGDGAGVWSLVHSDDVASATLAAIERAPAGIYNVVDDDPAPVSEWLPALAAALGAPPPRRVPRWLARLVGGEQTVSMMTSVRGSSNAKFKRELGWEPAYPSWRQGFLALGGAPSSALAA